MFVIDIVNFIEILYDLKYCLIFNRLALEKFVKLKSSKK
jgi:hypothetical protein